MTNDEYMNFVNSESDPGNNTLNIEYIKFANSYFATANTDLGKFKSDLFQSDNEERIEKFFDIATEEIKAQYDSRKGKQVVPQILSFSIN